MTLTLSKVTSELFYQSEVSFMLRAQVSQSYFTRTKSVYMLSYVHKFTELFYES
jgi:hypothetical protein